MDSKSTWAIFSFKVVHNIQKRIFMATNYLGTSAFHMWLRRNLNDYFQKLEILIQY